MRPLDERTPAQRRRTVRDLSKQINSALSVNGRRRFSAPQRVRLADLNRALGEARKAERAVDAARRALAIHSDTSVEIALLDDATENITAVVTRVYELWRGLARAREGRE